MFVTAVQLRSVFGKVRSHCLIIALVAVCIHPGYVYAGELTVAVAANVQYAFEEIKDAFESQTGIGVKEVVGSSGKLAVQIENGASFDVFLSADTEYPQALHDKGLTYGEPKIYAYGALVLWTARTIDLSKGLALLADPSVNKIAIASPKTAPYGRQAVRAMEHEKIYEQVKHKLVYGESIAQVNQFIFSQAAEIGITAKSSVFAPSMKGQGTWAEVDKNIYEPIAQGAVVLKHASENNVQDAQKFMDFIFSNDGRAVLEKYGYVLPE
jgi:molybdate transport system substrate-binding protein